MRRRAIVGADVYTPDALPGPTTVVIDDDRIAAIGAPDEVPLPEGCEIIDGNGAIVGPGLIDLHTHGVLGNDLMGGDLAAAAASYPQFGVTSFLATTLTRPHEQLLAGLREAGRALGETNEGASCLGVHLEGPYLAADRPGMADPDATRPFSWAEFEQLNGACGGRIRLVTLAPKRLPDLAVVQQLSAMGIQASIGHTSLSYAQALSAVDSGMMRATHLFNAMPPLHHRAPGVLAALLLDDRVWVELIADGVHVSVAALEIALRSKGPVRAMLVSDSAPQAGLPPGDYMWGDTPVRVSGQRVELANGTLAGSWYALDQGVRTMALSLSRPLDQALAMASRTPAQSLGLTDRGQLSPGLRADIVLLDDGIRPLHTIVAGRTVWRRASAG
jgi:N-acetylglucosamine-6-phosphate deacetylase